MSTANVASRSASARALRLDVTEHAQQVDLADATVRRGAGSGDAQRADAAAPTAVTTARTTNPRTTAESCRPQHLVANRERSDAQ